jgi:hypothetical protein
VVETRALDHRASDNNARRHAGIYALHDWVGGSDPQWLIRGPDVEYFSHDHGHYFPGGPSWTVDGLRNAVATPYQLAVPATGLDRAELERLASRIEDVTEQEVESCLSKLPAGWPVSDEELQVVAEFVGGRRSGVAQRLRALAGAV